MPGILAAEFPAALSQHFQHVTVADFRARKGYFQPRQRVLERKIAHLRARHAAVERAAALRVARDHIQQLVAVIGHAARIHHHQAVAIAVERDAEIGAMRLHGLLQCPRAGRAHVAVDIKTVGRGADGNHLRAQFMQHRRRDVVARAVRAVHYDLQTMQIQIGGKGAFAKFNITARRIADAAHLADVRRRRANQRLVDLLLDGRLNAVRELGAVTVEKLDAVVVVRVMRRADHHARRQSQRAREIRHRRRGHRPNQQHVNAGGSETRLKRGLKHITGHPRIFTDQYRRALGARYPRRQHLAGGIAEAHHEIGSDRRLADLAANAVRAKIFSGHGFAEISDKQSAVNDDR